MPARVLHESLSPRIACGLQGIGQLSAVFGDIRGASSVLDDVDVIVDEGLTVFNVTQYSESRHSAWSTGPERIAKPSTRANERLPTCRFVGSLSGVSSCTRDVLSVPDDVDGVADERSTVFYTIRVSDLWFVA